MLVLIQKLYIDLLNWFVLTLILLILHLVEFAIFVQDCCLQDVMGVLEELIDVVTVHAHGAYADISAIEHRFTYDFGHLLWGARAHLCSIFT